LTAKFQGDIFLNPAAFDNI